MKKAHYICDTQPGIRLRCVQPAWNYTGAEKNYYLMRCKRYKSWKWVVVGMLGNVVEQETISMRGSLSGNKVSLPAGKQPNLLFFKGLR